MGTSLANQSDFSASPTRGSRKSERLLLLFWILSLPFLNPWVRGDGVGYYAFARAPLIQHNLDFTEDYRPRQRKLPRPPLRRERSAPAHLSNAHQSPRKPFHRRPRHSLDAFSPPDAHRRTSRALSRFLRRRRWFFPLLTASPWPWRPLSTDFSVCFWPSASRATMSKSAGRCSPRSPCGGLARSPSTCISILPGPTRIPLSPWLFSFGIGTRRAPRGPLASC